MAAGRARGEARSPQSEIGIINKLYIEIQVLVLLLTQITIYSEGPGTGQFRHPHEAETTKT